MEKTSTAGPGLSMSAGGARVARRTPCHKPLPTACGTFDHQPLIRPLARSRDSFIDDQPTIAVDEGAITQTDHSQTYLPTFGL
ncbi:MAG TPA: hypothetical protein VGY13_00525 [Solirubrobacteraceae bacterium]|nr:hypothetical protein [Solirubrobacteraceae bacterium]